MTFVHEHQVVFSDLDALGHMNSNAYLRLMEAARIAWCNSVGLNHPWYKPPFIVASVRCEYMRAVDEPVLLRIELWCSMASTRTWTLDYRIIEGQDPVAIGRTVQVQFDYDRNQAVEIPDEVRRGLDSVQAEPLRFRGDP